MWDLGCCLKVLSSIALSGMILHCGGLVSRADDSEARVSPSVMVEIFDGVPDNRSWQMETRHGSENAEGTCREVKNSVLL